MEHYAGQDNKHRKYVPYATCDSGLGVAAKTKLRDEAEKKMIEEKKAMLALGYGEDEIDKTDGEKEGSCHCCQRGACCQGVGVG